MKANEQKSDVGVTMDNEHVVYVFMLNLTTSLNCNGRNVVETKEVVQVDSRFVIDVDGPSEAVEKETPFEEYATSYEVVPQDNYNYVGQMIKTFSLCLLVFCRTTSRCRR